MTDKSGNEARAEQWEEAGKDACGGEVSFPLSSADGVPFQLYIRYPKRLHADGGYVYSGGRTAINVEQPVLVEYNLFTLQADRVVYDSESRSVEAKGHVVLVNDSGATQSADAMTFRLENGQAIPLR